MRIYQILFSPTGGTKKVAAPFAEVFGREVSTIDLTDASMDFSQISLAKEDICVVAVPSFGGQVPAIAAERLERIRANGAMAILVVVYGNRAYPNSGCRGQDEEDLQRAQKERTVSRRMTKG